ncbi:MAG: hypothetical protein QW797_08930 [Thermoproteota archaeon]
MRKILMEAGENWILSLSVEFKAEMLIMIGYDSILVKTKWFGLRD